MRILKQGDTIMWSFADNEKHVGQLKGKAFKAQIAHVDMEERVYCVHASYGQDKIPFLAAKLVSKKLDGDLRKRLTQQDNGSAITLSEPGREEFIEFWHYGEEDLKVQQQENVRLFFDARKVVLNCNKLPSQLLEERDKLLGFVKTVNTNLTNGELAYKRDEFIQITKDLLKIY